MKRKLYYISIFAGILLMSCEKSKKETDWDNIQDFRDNAQQLSSKMYNTKGGGNIEVIDNLEGYKIILWHNYRGSDMEIIKID